MDERPPARAAAAGAEPAVVAPQGGFARCLFVCGITSVAVRNALIRDHSFDSLATIVSLTNDDLETTAMNVNKTRRTAQQGPLVVNAIHVRRLKAMRLWALWQVRCSIALNDDDFNEDQLKWGMERQDFEDRFKASDASDTPEPPKLKKIGFEVWDGFWRQFKNYCDTKRGAMKIPISYVFREHVVPTAEIMAKEYADSDESLMNKVSLTGPDYKFDNKMVWGILTRLVGDGSAWPFIKSLADTYDGRKAITILKTQSQGTASTSSRQARAFHTLKTATYDGKSNKSTFDTFVGILQLAFTELDDCGIILSESQKVDYLISGFHGPEKSNLTSRLVGSEFENDFGECCSHIAQFLAKTAIWNGPGGAKRSISSVTKTKFTDEEWHALTAKEKQEVQKHRKKIKAKAAKGSATKATPPARSSKKVAAVATTLETDDAVTSDEEVPMKPPAKKKK
jgi:hypothetical protein